MPQRPYEKLIVWQEAFKLTLWVYQITKKFPADERFGVISQMRRSASSVPMNIAEGNVKRSAREKAHFLETALASLEELHCQFRIALGLSYVTQQEFDEADGRIHRISYLLNKLRSSIL
ncbi:four helix bundle protein [Candidatus Peregrinibacteria bacterium]|nr:four helix bundle protein [Candidatus Peregrinibacteria bacterium]MBI3816644.1 four helix bundle protein [Candidatus Peregrinibacteria bacterium]